jgi:hypothetical protein
MARLGTPRPPRGPALDPDVPVPGCFRIRLRRGAPWSAVRIWLGLPVDPLTGEEMSERGYRWQATLNGAPADIHDLWPGCAREPISREEHDRIVELNRTPDEESPFYDPARRIDLASAPPPF